MLRKLIIDNYAIIDHLEIEFGSGLNILTGETGAGKSIIVDAVNLLLGERLSGSVLRKGAKKGYIEGIFDIASLTGVERSSAGELLEGAEENGIVLRRELGLSGGKAFINGKASTIQKIKGAVGSLIDLHGQHQHQSLLYTESYYDILDRYGQSAGLAGKTAAAYRNLLELHARKNELVSRQNELDEMRDYLEFQLKEIRSANPEPGEEAELKKEWIILQNAEKIITLTHECYRLLYDAEESAAALVRQAQRLLSELRSILPEYEPVEKDLISAMVNIEESASVLQKHAGGIEYNPQRLEEINQRLSTLSQLQKKYKCDIPGILEKAVEIEESLQSGESLREEINRVSEEITQASAHYGGLCIKLSQKRKQAAERLQKSILERLKILGMEKSLFNVEVRRCESAPDSNPVTAVIDGKNRYQGDEHGIDTIQFLIATGKAESMLPVSHIASGGELSRIMLAIKSVLMKADRVPVLIFDEVDTGISGRIASAVGRELNNLAQFHQLLCVTHLPQIACMASRHFSVEKIEHNGRIVTRMKKLDYDGRKREIAKLLAGDKVTDLHLKSAEEMLKPFHK